MSLTKIIIVPDEPGAEPREYALPRGVHVNVQEGERVRAGEPLMDGPSNPHDILNVLGEKALQGYLERHDGPADSGGDRVRVLPPGSNPGGRTAERSPPSLFVR